MENIANICKQEFGEDFYTCNIFRVGDIIVYKAPSGFLQFNVKDKTWDNPEYANLIGEKIPLKLCQRKMYVFRGTYFGDYLNTFMSGDLTSNDLNFLFPEYEFIVEQAIKLKLPFLLKAFRDNKTGFLKNLNTTSLVKAIDISGKQLVALQSKIITCRNDFIYYFVRLNKIVPSFKGLNEDVFDKLLQIALNDKVTNQDLDFYYNKIVSKPGNLMVKLNKVIKYIDVNFIEYHNFWEMFQITNNIDLSEFPEFPKPEEVINKLAKLQTRAKALADKEYYDMLNWKYSSVKEVIEPFLFSGSDYSIIMPTSVEELDYEGDVLHHCVGSYKENIANGKEIILFLRKNSDLKTPFYTIDLDCDGYIRQIHTKYNHNISEDKDQEAIIAFLNEWGKNKSNIINQKSIKLNYGALGHIE